MSPYGWRAKVGVVLPSSNTTVEPEFHRWFPDGVSLHCARMRLRDVSVDALTDMANEADASAERLADASVDAIAYACTTGSLVHGRQYAIELERRLTDAGSAPAIVTALSVVRSLKSLDADHVSIATPYRDELNEREVEFLETHGIQTVAISGLGLPDNRTIGSLNRRDIVQQIRTLDRDGADALFISCTNYPVLDVVDILERDVRIPIVTSNNATIWDLCRTVGIETDGPGPLNYHTSD